MSLYDTFKTSTDHETAGVWIEYGRTPPTPAEPNGEMIGVKIARAGGKNTAFNKALEKATKPFRKGIANGSVSLDSIENLYRGVFIEHVVLDWKNIEAPALGADGKAVHPKRMEKLPFNKANVERVFRDLPDLYADLKDQSTSLSVFRDEALEEDLGNSGQS